MDKLTCMRIFTLIATKKSFKGVAEQLGLAPSVISKHLNALEKDLGVKLIERTTRTAKITEMGDFYLSKCIAILDEIDDIEITIANESGQLKGPLTISAPPGFAHRHIAPHLPLFFEAHPSIQLNLITSRTDSDYLLSNSDLQIKISETATNEGFNMCILAPNRRTLVAAPGYLEAAGTPTNVSELAYHKIITLERGHHNNDWHFKDENGQIQTYKAHGHLRLDSGDTILRATLNNGGLSMLPTYIVGRHIASGALLPLLEALVDEHTPVHAIWRVKNHRTPKIDAFLDFLKTIYGDLPYWDELTTDNQAAALRASK